MARPEAPTGAVYLDHVRWHYVDDLLPRVGRRPLHRLMVEQPAVHSVQVVPEPMDRGGGHLVVDGDSEMMWVTIGRKPDLTGIEARQVLRSALDRVTALARDGWGPDADLDQRIPRPALPAPAVRRDPDTGEITASSVPRPPTPADIEDAAGRLADDIAQRVGLYRRYAEQRDWESWARFIPEVAAGIAWQRWQAEFTAAGGRLNLAAVRENRSSAPTQAADTREPPTCGPGARIVTYGVDGRPERWVTIAPKLEAAQQRQQLLMDLCHVGPFTTITVREGALPKPNGGNTAAYTDTDGRAHLEVTIADNLDDGERARIVRHELGHVIDVCAAGDQWADVFADHDTAEQIAEQFERPVRHCTLAGGPYALAAARAARGVTP